MRRNIVELIGDIGELEFSHSCNGEKFYRAIISVMRWSLKSDQIPIIISEYFDIEPNTRVHVIGSFRSRPVDGILTHSVLVEQIENTDEDYLNLFIADGYISKSYDLRETPRKRNIKNFSMAVKRKNGKPDCIMCIAWKEMAYIANDLPVGERITITGRVQSRTYRKNIDGEVYERTVYEVSVTEIESMKKREVC